MENRFIDSSSNDSFVNLRGLDLQELLLVVENYYLKYRDKLNIPADLTFGIELEYEGISKIITDTFISKFSEWTSKSDSSLKSGGEVSSPIMEDSQKDWEELKKICEHLKKRGANTKNNAAGHIHIGANALGEDVEAWKTFLKLYTAYEHILFRFFYGDKLNGRKELYHFAPPIAVELYSKLGCINLIKKVDELRWILDCCEKFKALNFGHVQFYDLNTSNWKNTLEFRSPNATTEAVICQNNINAAAKIVDSS